MPSETIVAVFDNAARAQDAITALIAGGVPSTAIQQYSRDQGGYGGEPRSADPTSSADYGAATSADVNRRGGGFWAWLTGESPAEVHSADHARYDRSIESGGTVVTVVVDSAHAERVVSTLSEHGPTDLDEHGGRQARGMAQPSAEDRVGAAARGDIVPQAAELPGSDVAAARPAGMVDTGIAGTGRGTTGAVGSSTIGTGMGRTGAAATGTSGEQVLPLAAESLQVGKRAVDGGTTRVRRYVIERPVEEQVSLRDETVRMFRRPASGSAAVGADAFTDKTIEMRERTEQPVVSKSARVVEEVVLQKDIQERQETVRDTVRRDEVEVQDDRTAGGQRSVAGRR